MILNTLLNGIGAVAHTRYDDVTTVIFAGLRDQTPKRARGTRVISVYCTRDPDTLILPQIKVPRLHRPAAGLPSS